MTLTLTNKGIKATLQKKYWSEKLIKFVLQNENIEVIKESKTNYFLFLKYKDIEAAQYILAIRSSAYNILKKEKQHDSKII